MLYALGALFPILVLIAGVVLLTLGAMEPHTNLATPGSVLVASVLITLSLRPPRGPSK